MSFEAAAWAIKQRPESPTEKLILIALADCMNSETGRCFPSVDFLAEAALCSKRTAQRAIKSLESQGFINRSFRVNDTPLYRLNLGGCQNVTRCQDDDLGCHIDTSRGVTGVTLTRKLTKNNKPGVTAAADFVELHTSTEWAADL